MYWSPLSQSPPAAALPTTISTSGSRGSNAITTTTTTLPTDEIPSILAVTTGFLSALSNKSLPDLDRYCVRAGGMTLWPPAPSEPRFCTIGAFVEQIAKLQDDIDERIWDPDVRVSETGDLASVWAPFRARVDGVVHHVGVEVFVLHKIEGEWKITGLADSCRWPTTEEKVSLL